MASKNNPQNRDNQRLVVLCPETGEEMKLIKVVPGGMFYVSPNGKKYPVYKGAYKSFEHKWMKK